MLNRIIAQRFGLPRLKANILTHLMLLAASLMGLNVIAYTTASSLFLTNVGSQKLPICYIVIGVISIPVYTVFSNSVARYNRLKLLQILLLSFIILSAFLRFLLVKETLINYYILFIVFYFYWVIHLDILFPSLVSDYLNTLEYKRYAALLGIAEAVGGLLGGAIASVLPTYLSSSADMLLVLPLLLGGTFGLLLSLGRSEKLLIKADEYQVNHWLLKDLKTFVNAIAPAPIAIFLAMSTFLTIIIQTIAEIQYFSIYSLAFPSEQQLSSVLGLLWMVNNVVQLVVLQFFTDPMLQWQGVKRMNLAYPITTFVSFVGLALNFKLPLAIFAHLNRDALDRAINRPIHTLNYNAVPHQFAPQVRSIADGLFYSVGLSVAGAFLWLAELWLKPFQMPAIGIGLSLMLFALRYFMGKNYLRSLLGMLRSSPPNLSIVSKKSPNLTEMLNQRVFHLLRSPNCSDLLLGLELATRLDNPISVLPEVKELLFKSNSEYSDSAPLVRTAVFKFLGVVRDRSVLPQLGEGLTDIHLAVRSQAATALANYGESSLEIASAYLYSSRLEVVETAIAAIAKVGTRRAETILYDYFKPSFRLLSRTLQWLPLIPDDASEWYTLKISLNDFHQRLCYQVLYTLSCLDRCSAFRDVQQTLYATNARARANAIELLASGRNQRFMLPLMPLLEGKQEQPLQPASDKELSTILENAMVCGDRWIEIGAFIVADKHFPWQSVKSFIYKDLDHLVKPIAASLDLNQLKVTTYLIEKLLFLKNVSLFKNLFFEEILILEQKLNSANFLAGEIILSAGTINHDLYLVYKGVVNLVDSRSSSLTQINCLNPSEYFGEMALLEDYETDVSLVASTDCTLFVWSRVNFNIFVDCCPRLIAALSQSISAS